MSWVKDFAPQLYRIGRKQPPYTIFNDVFANLYPTDILERWLFFSYNEYKTFPYLISLEIMGLKMMEHFEALIHIYVQGGLEKYILFPYPSQK